MPVTLATLVESLGAPAANHAINVWQRSLFVANRTPPGLGSLPLIVLSEGKPNNPFMQEHIHTWFELQDELAHLSTNGHHIVAAESAHAIHRTEPDLIFNAVREVVAAVRGASP